MSDDEIEIIRSEEEFQRQNKLIGSLQIENKRLNLVEKQLQKEIEQLNLKLKNIESEKVIRQVELRNWKAQLESNFKRSEMQNIQYEITLNGVQKKADKQRAYILQLEQQLQEYKNTREKEKLIQELKQQTQLLSQQILEKEEVHKDNLEQMKIQLEEAQKRIGQEQSISIQIKEQLKLMEDENKQQNEKVLNLINENGKYRSENENLQQQLEQMQLEIQNLSIQKGLTESEYQETQNKTKQFIEELHQQQQAKLILQQRKIEEINNEMNLKKQQLDDMKINFSQLQDKLKESKDQILKKIQIEEENHKLQQQLKNNEENSVNQKNYITQLEKKEIRQQQEIQNLKKKILELDKKQMTYSKEKQTFIQTLGDFQTQMDESQIYKKKQENLIQRLQKELSEKEKEKEILLGINQLLQDQMNETKNSNVQLNNIIQNCGQMNNPIIDQNPKLNLQVNYKKEAALLKKQLDVIQNWSKTQINKLQSALDEIQNQNLEKTLQIFNNLISTKMADIMETKKLIDYFDKFLIHLEQELSRKQIILQHHFDQD